MGEKASGGGGRGGRSGGGGATYAELDTQFNDIVRQRQELARSEPDKYSRNPATQQKYQEWKAKDDALLEKQRAIMPLRKAAFEGSAEQKAQKAHLKELEAARKRSAIKVTEEGRTRNLESSYVSDLMEGGLRNRSAYKSNEPPRYKPKKKAKK